MRTLTCILIGILVFGFLTSFPSHSMETNKEGISYPEGDIQEIRIRGNYEPEDPQRLEKLKEELIEGGYLKSGETLKDKYPHFLDIGDEKFSEHPRFNYCYDKTPNGKKEPHINKNLRVRLYDVNENVIAEDYLRVGNFDEENNLYFTVSYIPYGKRGHYFQFVRLEGEKEVILWKPGIRGTAILSKAKLIDWSEPIPCRVDKRFKPTPPCIENRYKYRPETRCHHSRFKVR